jgi:uncharacterized protein (DUF362 family)
VNDLFTNGKAVVAYQADMAAYPDCPPFSPNEQFPEFPDSDISEKPNVAFSAVRACFHLSGLDEEHFGTAAWNPLGTVINAGETVLLKPNLIKESHPRDPSGWKYVMTHGSIIRAVADYVGKAVGPEGKIIVADAPQTDSSFLEISKVLGLDAIEQYFRSKDLHFEIRDLRKEEWTSRDQVIVDRRTLDGDVDGYVAFDLADHSEFVNHAGSGRYYGADYDSGEVNRHHSGGRHEYLISGTAIAADVVFNLPKIKTHKKAGITVALKNLVGINGDKNWLPHHTESAAGKVGDERPPDIGAGNAERSLVRLFQSVSTRIPFLGPLIHRIARRVGQIVFGHTEQVIRSGNWWGNDTVWRMCLDLNKILAYGTMDGSFSAGKDAKQKRHFALADGILAGEGRGPMNPDPVEAGLLVFGLQPASVDAACATLMGFNPSDIPIVRQAFMCEDLPLSDWDWTDINLLSNRDEWCARLPEIRPEHTFRFKPHFGWLGTIERAGGNSRD